MNPEPCPVVSVIIVNYNAGDELLDCVEALGPHSPRTEVIIVDNASVEGSLGACAQRFPHVKVIYSNENLGFAGGANLGAAYATAGIFVFLNPDTVPAPNCINQLCEELISRDGVAGPIISEGEILKGYGFTLDRMAMPRGMNKLSPALYVSGCCLGTTRGCFEAVGGFDNRYFLFYEEAEYCWQALRRGYAVRVVPTAALMHIGGTAASGGYLRNNRIETTSARILLGCRNSLTMLFACAPLTKVPLLVCASLLRNGLFAVFLLINWRPRDAMRLIGGIWWCIVQLPATRQRRNRPRVARASEHDAWTRISRRFFLWDLWRAGERALLVDMPLDPLPWHEISTAPMEDTKNHSGRDKPPGPIVEGSVGQ